MAYIPELGEAILQAIHDADLGYREVAELVGQLNLPGVTVSRSYVGELVKGRRASPEILIAVARVTRADPKRFLQLADYKALAAAYVSEAAGPTGPEILGAGIFELQRKYGRPHVTVRLESGRDSLTPEEAERVLRDTEAQVQREIEEEQRTGGIPPPPRF